ncbi:MAG: pyridoxal-phosphate-dependent aminotransferase family protein [Opitutales bacterium]
MLNMPTASPGPAADSILSNLLLMGPGPSTVYPSVYQALARPTLGHLDPDFIQLMDEVRALLRTVMRTENDHTLPLSGTGSAGMEAAFANFVEPGDAVLIIVNGVFGKRMVEVATRLGAKVEALEFEWGTPVVTAQVAEKLETCAPDVVAVVHAETSTGVRNPVAEIAELVRPTGALFFVDAVTSLCGLPVEVDAWGVDMLYSGTQKCLSCPPGLAPFTFSERAAKKAHERSHPIPNWYLDVTLLTGYWEGEKRAYHHTAPINMIYGLHEALRQVVEEGLENVFARHRAAHEQLVAGLETLGCAMLVAPHCCLPMLNAVRVPEGVDEAAVRQRLRNEFHIEIGAGLGPLAGKIWRIGVMGHTARPEFVERFLGAFTQTLKDSR